MIKFRAWDNECEIIRDYDELKGLTLDALNASDFKLEPFTGLKDVNGKDIYIGDIIQYSDHFYAYSMDGVPDLETEYIGVIVKNNWALGILINRISHTDAHISHYNAKEFVPFCEFDDPEADVLLKGNIHANPELLEE